MCFTPLPGKMGNMRHFQVALMLLGLTTGQAVAAPAGEAASRPAGAALATQPATAPAFDNSLPAVDRREAEVRKLLDFLMAEYDRLLTKTPDRVGRSLLVICMSRIGRDEVTDRILELLATEKDPLVKLVAWQAALARAPLLSARQHQKWIDQTCIMARADLFRGSLKTAAAQALATTLPTRPARDAWQALFSRTSSADPRDVPVVDALADVLGKWKSPDLLDYTLRRAAIAEDAVRADRILRRLGSPAAAPSGADLRGSAWGSAGAHAKWFGRQKWTWKELKELPDQPWKALRPDLLEPPVAPARVDVMDPAWRRDLELKAPNLKALDVGFVVDATGSMQAVLDWLKSDLSRILQGLGAVALEPRIGLTFYRDKGDAFIAQTAPLTSRIGDLLDTLAQMKAEGGGDIPEAVLEGLGDSARANRWSQQPTARKFMVLIGDAPPHPETQEDCIRLAQQAAKNGFKIHAIKCAPNPPGLPSFDQIAAAGNGAALEVDMQTLRAAYLRRLAAAGVVVPPGAVAPEGAAAPSAGRGLLNQILVDVINPQFKDRIAPMVGVLWELLEAPARETAKDRPCQEFAR